MAGVHTFVTNICQARFLEILSLISESPKTRAELCILLNVSKPTMRRYIEHLRFDVRCMYVSRYAPTGGKLAPVYALGRSPDAKKPPEKVSRDYNVARWQRLKKDRNAHKDHLASERVRAKIRQTRKKPNTWLSALL